MGNSRVSEIYTALAAMSVTVSSITPTVYSLTGLPNAVETADLPCRILEIFDNKLSAQAQHSTLSGPARVPNMRVIWSLSDLLLWTPEGQGRGQKDVALMLVSYCGKYLDAVRANEALISTASITDVKPVPGIYEYPLGSENFYFGALTTLSITELIET